METRRVISFLIDNPDAAEILSGLEENDFFGIRFEPESDEEDEYMGLMAEKLGLESRPGDAYDISNIDEESARAITEASTIIAQGIEEGFNFDHSEKQPSYRCGECGSGWIGGENCHYELYNSEDTGKVSSRGNCRNCSQSWRATYFVDLNIVQYEGVDVGTF